MRPLRNLMLLLFFTMVVYRLFAQSSAEPIYEIQFSGDGQLYGIFHSDCIPEAYTGQKVDIYDTRKGVLLFSIQPNQCMYSFDMSEDGTQVALGLSGITEIWSLDTGEKKSQNAMVPAITDSVRWHPVYDYIGFLQGNIRISDNRANHVISFNFDTDDSDLCQGNFGPDMFEWFWSGQQLVSIERDDCIRTWDFETGEVIRTIGYHEDVSNLAVKPTDTQIATVSNDGSVKIWDVDSMTIEVMTYQVHDTAITSVEWHPSGLWIASADIDGHIHIWNPDNGTIIYSATYLGRVNDLAWHPSGDYLIYGGEGQDGFTTSLDKLHIATICTGINLINSGDSPICTSR